MNEKDCKPGSSASNNSPVGGVEYVNYLPNLMLKVCFTSLAITGAVTPFNVYISHIYRGVSPTPLAFAHAVRRALPSNVLAGQQKGMSSNTCKHFSETTNPKKISESAEENLEEVGIDLYSNALVNRYIQAGLFSQAEIIMSSYHSNKAALSAIHANLDASKNMFSIFKAGYFFKTVGGYANFLAITQGKGCSNRLVPSCIFSGNPVARSALDGVCSGMVVSILTYPVSVMHDTLMAKINADASGKLNVPSSMSFFNSVRHDMRTMGLTESAKSFCMTASKVLPARICVSVIIYAMIYGMNDALGDKPFDDLSAKLKSSSSR